MEKTSGGDSGGISPLRSSPAAAFYHYTTTLHPRQQNQSGKPFPDQLNFADQQFDGYGVSFPNNVFFPDRHFYSDGHFMPTDSQTVLSLPTNFSLVLTLQFPTNYLVLFIFPTNFGIVFFFLKRCFAFPNDI